MSRLSTESDFKTPNRVSRRTVGGVETARDSSSVPAINPTEILTKWEEDNLLSKFWAQITYSLRVLIKY